MTVIALLVLFCVDRQIDNSLNEFTAPTYYDLSPVLTR